MWVFLRSDDCYTTGFFDPKGLWHPDKDFSTAVEAAARVHYLNGGGVEEEDSPSWSQYKHIKERPL
jgi:hypothetical protein